MARLIYTLYNERALRRERVVRDRTSPWIYDEEFIQRFYFSSVEIFSLVEQTVRDDLRFQSDRNAALTPTLQLLIALRFYAKMHFKTPWGTWSACINLQVVELFVGSRWHWVAAYRYMSTCLTRPRQSLSSSISVRTLASLASSNAVRMRSLSPGKPEGGTTIRKKVDSVLLATASDHAISPWQRDSMSEKQGCLHPRFSQTQIPL